MKNGKHVGKLVHGTYRVDQTTQRVHLGEVLSVRDPRAWEGTIAFPGSIPVGALSGNDHQQSIEEHCRKHSITEEADQVPVLWSFGKVYWESVINLNEVDQRAFGGGNSLGVPAELNGFTIIGLCEIPTIENSMPMAAIIGRRYAIQTHNYVYVVALVSDQSIRFKEWHSGTYYETKTGETRLRRDVAEDANHKFQQLVALHASYKAADGQNEDRAMARARQIAQILL